MLNLLKIMLLLDPRRESDRALLCGIRSYAHLHGPWSFYYEPIRGAEDLPSIKDNSVDGIIARITNPKVLNKILDTKIPAICIRQPDSLNLHNIIDDGNEVGSIAVNHFKERGFLNFAYCGYSDKWWAQERGRDFLNTLSKHDDYKVYKFSRPESSIKKSWAAELKILAEWLLELPKPIGILACDDNRGRHIIEACKIADLKLPGDISVLGIDNDESICTFSDPPLSSIVENTQYAGYQAAALIADTINEKVTCRETIVIKATHVAVRQSSSTLAMQDSDVVEAITYIDQNFSKPIQVADVLQELKVSRRCLELKFKRALGRSIYDHIRHVRVENIAKLLATTSLPISQIALESGISDPRHIARFFRKIKGANLKNFRTLHSSKMSPA